MRAETRGAPTEPLASRRAATIAERRLHRPLLARGLEVEQNTLLVPAERKIRLLDQSLGRERDGLRAGQNRGDDLRCEERKGQDVVRRIRDLMTHRAPIRASLLTRARSPRSH